MAAPKPATIAPTTNTTNLRLSPSTTKDAKYVPISHKRLPVSVITALAILLTTVNTSSRFAPVKGPPNSNVRNMKICRLLLLFHAMAMHGSCLNRQPSMQVVPQIAWGFTAKHPSTLFLQFHPVAPVFHAQTLNCLCSFRTHW